jgi:hypothetical protein
MAAGLGPGPGTHLHILLDRGLEPEPTGKNQGFGSALI